MNENLAWLTQKTENVNAIEQNCKVVKKVATAPFLHQPSPPFSGLSPLPSDSIFGRSYPPPPFKRGGFPTMTLLWCFDIVNFEQVNAGWEDVNSFKSTGRFTSFICFDREKEFEIGGKVKITSCLL